MTTTKASARTATGDGHHHHLHWGGAEEPVDLSTVLAILRRRWWVILLSIVVCVGAALAYTTLTPKTWRASARVLLDPRDKQIVGTDPNRFQTSIEPGWVETRLELVKAFGTLAAVVKSENLVADPEILASTGPRSEDPAVDAVRNLAEIVLVERPKENNLIDVTVTTKSPDKSARLANAVAASFVAALTDAKIEQVEQANGLLARQIDDMRRKMLEAETKVEDYKRENGISMTRGALVDEETMRQANETLNIARTRTQEARERADRLRQVLQSGDPTVHSQIDALGSAVLSRLKIEAAMAMRRKIELEQSLGPRHPRVGAANAEVERARAQVADEVRSLSATADLDFQIARANEDNARKAVDRAQARLADTKQATVGLQDLENEANARRELYKSFVSRMEETTLQRTTQISDARIVSPAQVPLTPFSPKRTLAVALALVAGLGIGLVLALWSGRPKSSATAAAAPHPTTPPAPAVAVAPPPVVPATSPPPTVAGAEARSVGRIVDLDAAAAPTPAPAAEPAHGRLAQLLDVPGDAVGSPAATLPEATPAPESTGPAVASPAVVDDTAETVPMPAAAETVAPDAAADRVLPRAVLPLSLDRIARLGAEPGAGRGVTAALTETADGAPDEAAARRIADLARELGLDRQGRPLVVFSTGVPTLLTAAIAHALAGAVAPGTGGLFDLAHDGDVLDAAFAAADLVDPPAGSADTAIELECVRDAAGLRLSRPIDPVSVDDPDAVPSDLGEVVDLLAAETPGLVVHLGRSPAAALLFDVAAVGAMVLVVDEPQIADRRILAEIEVMADLLPSLGGLIVLAREDGDVVTKPTEPRRRRVRA